MKNKRPLLIVFITIILLLIPLIAMQFTDEVNWNFLDFVVAGFLFLGTGLACEFSLRKIKKPKHRVVACIVLFIILFLLWAELAVGIFGTPFSGS